MWIVHLSFYGFWCVFCLVYYFTYAKRRQLKQERHAAEAESHGSRYPFGIMSAGESARFLFFCGLLFYAFVGTAAELGLRETAKRQERAAQKEELLQLMRDVRQALERGGDAGGP